MTKRKNVPAYVAIALATLLSVLGFLLLKNIDTGCSYSREVCPIDKSQVGELSSSARKRFKYGIEEMGLVHTDGSNEPDVLGVYRVRGWCLENTNGEYRAGAVGLLLRNADGLYEVELHTDKDPDYANDYTKFFGFYSEQDTGQQAGFFCCIPEDSVDVGKYQIGLRVKNDGGTAVLWTDSYIEFDVSDRKG